MVEHDQEDPQRLSSNAVTPPGLAKLFESAQRDAPRGTELDRAWTAIARRTGPGGMPPAGSAIGWKIGAAVALIAIGGVVLWATRAPRAPERASDAVAPTPVTPQVRTVPPPTPTPSRTTVEPSAVTPRSATPERRSRARSSVRAVATPDAPPNNSVVVDAPDEFAEGALLLRARRALATDPSLALSLAQEHLRLAPAGRLAPERDVIAIEALGALGRATEARAGAERFVARWPESAHRPRVERWLAHN